MPEVKLVHVIVGREVNRTEPGMGTRWKHHKPGPRGPTSTSQTPHPREAVFPDNTMSWDPALKTQVRRVGPFHTQIETLV